MADVYRVRQGIAHETIEGEAVVLNLSTGTYFSLAGAAAFAWSLLQDGAGAAHLAAALGQRYAGQGAAIDAAVSGFVAELAREGLIEKAPGAPARAVPAHDGPAEPFPGLGLQRYTDIQELLMIDPVHEVHERGWPVRADGA